MEASGQSLHALSALLQLATISQKGVYTLAWHPNFCLLKYNVIQYQWILLNLQGYLRNGTHFFFHLLFCKFSLNNSLQCYHGSNNGTTKHVRGKAGKGKTITCLTECISFFFFFSTECISNHLSLMLQRWEEWTNQHLLVADEMRAGGEFNASNCTIITVSSLKFIISISTTRWIYA